MRLLVFLAALSFGLGIVLPARAQNTFTSDVLMCSGRPWIDVRCNGAIGDDIHDDTAAINTTVAAAITGNFPVHIPAGTYKVTSKLTWDYQGIAGNGLNVISRGAVIDGRTIAAGNVLQIQCSGGTTASPAICNHLFIENDLYVLGSTPAYVVALGKTDLSDIHNAANIDHLVVTNSSANAAAGAIQANYLTNGSLWLFGTTAGGNTSTAAVAFEQVQSSRIGGSGVSTAASGANAAALLLENGATKSNAVIGFVMTSNTCLSITSATASGNTFITPTGTCAVGVNGATSANNNVMIGPAFSGATPGPLSGAVSMVGRGALGRYNEPTTAALSVFGVDDGTIVSARNATGSVINYNGTLSSAASLPVTLPSPSSVGPGWTMGFVTDASKAVVLTAPSGSKILAGGLQLGALTVGPGNFEVAVVKSDGGNFRLEFATTNTRQLNGIESAHFPANWVFPPGPGYSTTQGDNGSIFSSKVVGGPLAVQFPQISSVQPGWTIGVAADPANPVTIATNPSGGGLIVLANGTTITTGGYTFGGNAVEVFQFDGAAYRQTMSAGQIIAQNASMTDNRTTAIIAEGAGVQAFSSPNAPSAQTIYNQSVMSGSATTFQSYDSVRGIAAASPFSTVNTITGVAGYAMNNTVPIGQRAQTVALLGVGVCAANGSQCWGVDTIVSDNSSLGNTGVTAGTGKFLYNEFDLNITSPNTQGAALQVGGTSFPSGALNVNALSVQKLWGSGGVGTGLGLFANGLITADACCAAGVTIGATALSGNGVASQPLMWNYRNAGGAYNNTTLAVLNGALFLGGSEWGATVNGLFFPARTGPIANALISANGATTTFSNIGTVATSGANVNSQTILFNYTDASATPQNITIQASQGSLFFGGTAGIAGNLVLPAGAYVTGNNSTSPNGLSLGAAAASGVNVPSQFALWSYFDASGATQNYNVRVDSTGALALVSASAAPVVTVNGSLTMGSNAALPTTAVAPFLYVGTMAGAPTGVPALSVAGRSAVINDTTNHRLCWYEQAASLWKCVSGA